MVRIDDKEYTDEQIAQIYEERKKEYFAWRKQKAMEYLSQKKRDKYYYCDIDWSWNYEDGGVDERGEYFADNYLYFTYEQIEAIKAIKKRINDDPEISEADKSDYFYEEMTTFCSKFNDDPEVTWQIEEIYFDRFVYKYCFDVCCVDSNGQVYPIKDKEVIISDEDYSTLLAHLTTGAFITFEGLRHIEPKICNDIYRHLMCLPMNYQYFEGYIILMNNLRNDADCLNEQLEKSGEDSYIDFLSNPAIQMAAVSGQEK